MTHWTLWPQEWKDLASLVAQNVSTCYNLAFQDIGMQCPWTTFQGLIVDSYANYEATFESDLDFIVFVDPPPLVFLPYKTHQAVMAIAQAYMFKMVYEEILSLPPGAVFPRRQYNILEKTRNEMWDWDDHRCLGFCPITGIQYFRTNDLYQALGV